MDPPPAPTSPRYQTGEFRGSAALLVGFTAHSCSSEIFISAPLASARLSPMLAPPTPACIFIIQIAHASYAPGLLSPRRRGFFKSMEAPSLLVEISALVAHISETSLPLMPRLSLISKLWTYTQVKPYIRFETERLRFDLGWGIRMYHQRPAEYSGALESIPDQNGDV